MSCIDPTRKTPLNHPSKMKIQKYRPWKQYVTGLPETPLWSKNTRKWPDAKLLRAPRWCSVDLRDGNQALPHPMTPTQKLELLAKLIGMGFKEIEVGFPAASRLDFEFCRTVIEKKLIPDDVFIGVLVQARETQIEETVKAVNGARNVIIHFYNSTSELQRRVVFQKSKEQIKQMAVQGALWVKHYVEKYKLSENGSTVLLEYSPESFSGTEVSFALDVSIAVIQAWHSSDAPEGPPVILNLPETVQNVGPHFFADQIEWMHRNLGSLRHKTVLSVHPHNDRGTSVASAELALQAGADRVEGCLFGNGERTGNVCIITLASNLLQLGIDPELDLSNIPSIVETYERCTGMRVHERHPWAGELVFSAFSGSHQDAIKKGFAWQGTSNRWEVPYLPLDPVDLGRSYEAIVRVNAQSGKSGVAYLMERAYGIVLPRTFQPVLSAAVQRECDKTAREVEAKAIYKILLKEFIQMGERGVLVLCAYRFFTDRNDGVDVYEISPASGTRGGCGSSGRDTGSHENGYQDGNRYSENGSRENSYRGSRSRGARNTSSWIAVSEAPAPPQKPALSVAPCTASFTARNTANPSVRPLTLSDSRDTTTSTSTHSEAGSSTPTTLILQAQVIYLGEEMTVTGRGCGPLKGFLEAINTLDKKYQYEIMQYSEQALSEGGAADALCFVEVEVGGRGVGGTAPPRHWGLGSDPNVATASLRALCCAVNRSRNCSVP